MSKFGKMPGLVYNQLIKLGKSMFKMLKKIPEQINRLLIIAILILLAFIVLRMILVPEDFGELGHYRMTAMEEIVSQEMKFAGQKTCIECHEDVNGIKMNGYHDNVNCEVCHGPGVAHTNAPDENILNAPRDRDFCPVCHEYLSSRPTGFPQIVSESHNPMKSCISCHDPHDPVPPDMPKDCSACHAEISRTKSLSHHAYVECTFCHEVQSEHKQYPRQFRPTKPMTRGFCGKCHSKDASSDPGIPRVDLNTHETRYVCWQCHYPHLPEAN